MKILEIGYNTIHGKNYKVLRTHGINGYMLMILKSRCKIVINGMENDVESKSMIIYASGAAQEIYSQSEFFVYDWLHFEADGDEDFLSSLELPYSTVINNCDINFLSQLLKNIYNEHYTSNNGRIKVNDTLLKTLILKINETRPPNRNQQVEDPHYSELLELRDKIYNNPQIRWNVELMAAEVSMSRSYFQHIYREIFGVSCISDVIASKIEKAKEILSTTKTTISQVSVMCGYDNEEHFMRQFKKIVGVTPSVYRKNNGK
jgi:AraC family transcriptional regulator of arabinose operon